jgi:hypothetical protein
LATSSSQSLWETQTQLHTELLPGESALWTGQPLRKVVFHRGDWFAIPFSLMWGGFAIFWEYGASGHSGQSNHAPSSPISFFTIWGIPFIVIGQYMIWGRFFYAAWKKSRTCYAVTNKRILVLNIGGNRKLTDGYIDRLSSVTLTNQKDGVGTIEFAPEPERQSSWGSSRRGGISMDIDLSRLAFFDIPDAKSVYQMIQSQRERNRSKE